MTGANRVAVVTGGGRGIGRAIALALAGGGARVALLARSRSRLDDAAAAIAGAGGRAHPIACDVTSKGAVEAAFEEAANVLGPIDVLVNSAGVADSAPFGRLDEAQWDRTIAVNLKGTFLCTQAAIGGMVARGSGRVINIASVAGLIGVPYTAAYCASKHAVVGLTRSVAIELARTGVTVNAICPGFVETDMAADAIARIVRTTGRTEQQARQALEAMSPQRRFVRPEEVAAVALFLASDEAAGLTGQAIAVDGGQAIA
jgi:NAD(P)-dependent dehydrogenase (short-subunit alcohol dehydrogenase family)